VSGTPRESGRLVPEGASQPWNVQGYFVTILGRIDMKNSLNIFLAASALSFVGMISTVPASAQPSSFSFRAGDVSVGYNDGYYDHNRGWHSWRNDREHNWYRSNNSRSYRSMRHDRDHDGVPNRMDSRPNNPYRQ